MSALEMLSNLSTVPAGGDTDTENSTILAYLKKQGKQPDDMLRFFDRNSYYSLHGRDADTVATEYFKSSSCVRYSGVGEKHHAYLPVNKKMGAEIIRLALLHQRRRVEILKADRGSWVLERRGSPGNLQAFEDECLRDSDLSVDTSSVIVAVRIGKTEGSKGYAGNQTLVGCSFIDCTVRSIRTAEFEDDENLSTLESLVCQMGTREALLPPDLPEAMLAKLTDLFEMCEVPSTPCKKGGFGTKDAPQDLRRLLGSAELHGRCFDSSQQLAVSATCGLVKYLDLMGRDETHGQWTLDWVDAAQFMRLDSGAMRALSLEPQPGDVDKNASLLGIFSQCKTAMGARLVRKFLKQPLISAYEIEARYDLVEAFASGFETRSLLRDEVLPKLGGDLDRLGRKFAAKKGTLADVVSLYYFVHGLPKLLSTLEAHVPQSEKEGSLLKARFTSPLGAVHANFTKLCGLVEASIDLAAARRHEYVLQPHFSPRLKELDAERAEVVDALEAHHAAACRKYKLDVHLEHDGKFGHCFRVSRKDEAKLRSFKINTRQTKKDGVLFQDEALSSLADEYSEIAGRYNAEQHGLVSKVVDTARTFCPVITECHELLAELDVLLCFAHVSTSAPEPYVRPTLVKPEDARQRIVLKGCRHPCVERMEGVAFIKNDVELVRGASSLQIVTGPNMGGKSTYIRAAGVNVLLAQVGCFVPCDEAQISITDSILARVGAGDCQSRGVSTFMAEMLETATILKGATERSLVIIDELGRGTSTYDGYGLAWAISEHLASKVNCACLFATHFQELTELAQKHEQVTNRHVSAHIADNTMTMLYRVEDGPSDQSFGVNVAEVVKFPPTVIAAAKRKLEELEELGSANAEASAKAGKPCAPTTAVPAARARAALSDGERAAGMGQVRSFLSQFAALPLETMGEAEKAKALDELRGAMRGSDDALVGIVCAQADAASR